MSNIIHSRPLSSSSSSGSGSTQPPQAGGPAATAAAAANPGASPPSAAAKTHDWEADSTSSESKSSSSGGRYRPAWRPRREALNIDSIFTRERRRQVGYSPLGASLPEDCGAPAEGPTGSATGLEKKAPLISMASSWTLPAPRGRGRGGGAGGEQQQPPRLIQRMESGYESSERNSNSPVSLDMPLGEGSNTSAQHR